MFCLKMFLLYTMIDVKDICHQIGQINFLGFSTSSAITFGQVSFERWSSGAEATTFGQVSFKKAVLLHFVQSTG